MEFRHRLYRIKRFIQRANLPKQHAEGVYIHLFAVAEFQCHFGGHVPPRAARFRQRSVPLVRLVQQRGDGGGKPEIEHFDAIVTVKANVGGFQIPKDDVTGMEVFQCVGDAVCHLEAIAQVFAQCGFGGKWNRRSTWGSDSVNGATFILPLIDTVREYRHQTIENDKVPFITHLIPLSLLGITTTCSHLKRSAKAPLGPSVQLDNVRMVQARQQRRLVGQILGANDELSGFGAHRRP
mmetsp:Transcript_28936/g.61627  ORF Transcript_28936/g.61627 Transcript_28936/m.61627 type:complete len:237 (-) Transcript_28936:1679-2389(-)